MEDAERAQNTRLDELEDRPHQISTTAAPAARIDNKHAPDQYIDRIKKLESNSEELYTAIEKIISQ